MENLPAYMTKPKAQLSPGEFYRAWKAGRFKEGEEVRIKTTTPAAKKEGRFNEAQIKEMRDKENKLKDLQAKYEVSSAFIYAVRAKRVYKHIED